MRVPADSALFGTARPEHQLLLCCARTALDFASISRLRAFLLQQLDWATLVSAADRHGLLPLLYTHLKAQASDLTPASWLDFLQQRFQENHRNAVYLTGVLVKVLALLESQGISAIPYKGPVLAQELYGNLALRPFGDLDLLMRHRDVPRAAELLVAHGFVPESGSAALADRSAMQTAGQFAFLGDDGAALVELHSEVTLRHFPRRPDPGRVFHQPRMILLAERPIPTLNPAELLLFLAVHGTKDFWERLKWICDVAEFLRVHTDLNWRDVLDQAEALGCERMLRLALILARELLGAALPEEVQRACDNDDRTRLLAVRLSRGLFDEAQAMSAVERFLFRVRTHPQRWGGVRYAVRLAVTPAEEDRALADLPPALAPAYLLLRPLRLLHKYGLGRGRPSAGRH